MRLSLVPNTPPRDRLAVALDAIGARWFVFGAQAALVWGRPRLTTDVDVTVKCSVSTRALVRALETRGVSMRIDGTVPSSRPRESCRPSTRRPGSPSTSGQSDLTPMFGREFERWQRSGQ